MIDRDEVDDDREVEELPLGLLLQLPLLLELGLVIFIHGWLRMSSMEGLSSG